MGTLAKNKGVKIMVKGSILISIIILGGFIMTIMIIYGVEVIK